ncbi:unnamed protein product [marine sediment metagenome]|uniref:tRNA/rRNA methyltransferase SpoU type domain-containing protein n=1 Tax=marine sediment metagenome TaxID=412755 RepID=X0XK74_9ZZZZ
MRGFFAVGIYHPKKEVNIGTLWRSAAILGCSFIFTIGKRYKHQSSDKMKTIRHKPLFHFKDFDDFKIHLPYDCKIVAIEIADEAIDLKNYVHPRSACYLLGAEDYGIPNKILKKCHDVIKLQGQYCFNVSTAGSIVIYHRVALSANTTPRHSR